MDDHERRRVEVATVKILRWEGEEKVAPCAQGVLVHGGFIATAAHCVRLPDTGRLDLDVPTIEQIETADGRRIMLSVVLVEPVTDIALLALSEHLPDDAEKFERWTESTEPAPMATDDPRGPQPLSIFVLKQDLAWLTGTATAVRRPGGPRLRPVLAEQIPAGTSGGPIVDAHGRLVGVTSSDRYMPVLHQALPTWARQQILDAQRSFDPVSFAKLQAEFALYDAMVAQVKAQDADPEPSERDT